MSQACAGRSRFALLLGTGLASGALGACGGSAFSAGPSDAGADGTLTDTGSLDVDTGSLDTGRAPLDASPGAMCDSPPCLLAGNLNSPVAVALDDTDIFWSNTGTPPGYTDGTIERYELASGTVTSLFTTTAPIAIGLSLGQLHWLSAGGIVGVSGLDGKTRGMTTLLPGQPVQMFVDVLNIYVASAAPLPDGGAQGELTYLGVSTVDQTVMPFAEVPLYIPDVTSGTQSLYWTEVDFSSPASILGGGSVWRSSKVTPSPKLFAGGQPTPYAIVADAQSAYWSTFANGTSAANGTIRSAPTNALSGPVVLAETSSPALAMTQDTDNIYWAEYGAQGGIYQMAKTGVGAVVKPLATGQAYPRAIAVSNGLVVWVDGGTATEVDGGSTLLFEAKDGALWAAPVMK